MSFAEEFKHRIFEINEETFQDRSLEAFEYQYASCQVYQEYCNHLKRTPENVNHLVEIPFLPIEFFKNHAVKSGEWEESKIFKSSGTTATGRSQHFIKDLRLYHESAKSNFESFFGSLSEFQIIAILPSYQDQGDSSLISMVDYFMQFSKVGSGYFLESNVEQELNTERKKLIIGVSYALLDLAEKFPETSNAIIMETGGMKGRKKEITRRELHESLQNGFGVNHIWSEYGMTELQSQAYGLAGDFKFPAWAMCYIRDINDPLSYLPEGKTGGINVIDLANIDTCCFIETKDLGKKSPESFEVLGRFDNSDIRGCNLLI